VEKDAKGSKVAIEAVARTADAKGTARKVLTYNPPTPKPDPSKPDPPPPPSRRLFVLAIGLSTYKNPVYNLTHPAADAQALVGFFTKQKGAGLFQDVIPDVLPDNRATREEINEKLKWLAETPRATDIRILFLSGHGLIDKGEYFFGGYGYNEQQVLANTSVSWVEIFRPFRDVPGKTLVIIDTCHAGGAVQRKTKELVDPQEITNMLKRLDVDTNPGLVTIAAATSQETVDDDSIFFKALLKGLNGAAAAPNDSLIDVVKLGSFLTSQVQQDTKNRQHVILSGEDDVNVQNGKFPLVALKRP
jgi:uncharacterized caspase-like protein